MRWQCGANDAGPDSNLRFLVVLSGIKIVKKSRGYYPKQHPQAESNPAAATGEEGKVEA
jgi:hypothetical protein